MFFIALINYFSQSTSQKNILFYSQDIVTRILNFKYCQKNLCKLIFLKRIFWKIFREGGRVLIVFFVEKS